MNERAPEPDPGPTAALEALLAPDGWTYASTLPVEAGDPGRFHALFGRDSLIVALQLLHRRPDVAAATLRALAARQGRVEDPEIDEQPGRILHEWRPVAPAWLVAAGWPVRGGELRYYGSSDSTSWFLILLDAVLDATGDAALRAELAPAAAAAAGWLDRALTAGGGLVRCGPRAFPGGLAQQGWRDSSDPTAPGGTGGIVTPDGAAPRYPLADADSQAAAVAALRALVRLDPERAAHWTARLAALRARLSADFGPGVLALDGRDRPVPGAGSQLGWLLWADALDEPATAAAADRLTAPDVLTPHGLRTLSDAHPQFRVDGYHRGAVWPFDSWLGWAGLRRAGRDAAAERVRGGVLAALAGLGRYPELFAVDRAGRVHGVAAANRVQAWTVGAVLAWRDGWDGLTTSPSGAPRRAGSATSQP